MNIQISCSLGEIIDKITILDIKCDEIKEEFRLKECSKERESLLKSVSHLMNDTLEYYRSILKIINKNIWDDQEVIRYETDVLNYNYLAKKIIQDNDARFRVKNIINTIFNTSLKEQKSYKVKTCFVGCHPGLGDHICMVPAVRYLSILYDKIILPVREIYLENVKLLYSDFPFIEYITISSNMNESISDVNKLISSYKINSSIDLYNMGMFHPSTFIHKDWVPKGFYKDIGLDYNSIYLSKKWFFAGNPVDESIINKCKKYTLIVTHCQTSENNCIQIINKRNEEKNQLNTLVIDINENLYSKDELEKYELAEYFVNKPIVYYMSLLTEANKIFITNSSLYCLAVQMKDLKAKEKECYVRYRTEDIKNIDSRFIYYSF